MLDRADGAPLVGATVFIAPEETQAKDYNPQGTIAYEQGRFAFKLPASVRKVVVSYLGYEARTLDISGKSDFTIYLSASDNKVDAVVVTGYQRIEKRKLTSSISSVKMSDISRDGVATSTKCSPARSPVSCRPPPRADRARPARSRSEAP